MSRALILLICFLATTVQAAVTGPEFESVPYPASEPEAASGQTPEPVQWPGQSTDNTVVIPDTTLRIEPAVITGTRISPQAASLLSSISVVTREMIDQSGESAVLSLLPAYVPGLFITERGTTGFGVYSGSAGSISLRGVGANPTTQVLLAVDDHPQVMGINGHHLPDAFRSSETERIEIIRGPASTIYGSNAMGGVINIITRDPKPGVNTTLGAEYGSFNTQKYSVANSVRTGRFSSHIAAGHDRTDGHRRFSDFRLTNTSAKLGYDISDKYKVTGSFSLSKYFSTDPGTVDNPSLTDTLTADVLRVMSSVGIENSYHNASGALRFYYNHGDHDLYYGWLSKDNSYGAMLYQSMQLFRGSTITAGVDLQHYGGRATDTSRPAFDLDKYLDQAAGYMVVDQEFFGRLHLNAGLRLEHNSHFGREWVPQGGISYLAGKTSTIKASAAKGFRWPTFREMYVVAPNDELRPEEMMNYEIGYSYVARGGRFRGEITVYYTEGTNIIEMVVAGGVPSQYFNSGEFYNRGVELSAGYSISDNARVSANYSYVDMNKAMLAAPRQQINIVGEHSWGRVNISANVQFVEGLYTRLGGNPAKNNFTLVGAAVRYSPSRAMELFVKADNILDQSYQMTYGYPMPGVSFTGGIRVHI